MKKIELAIVEPIRPLALCFRSYIEDPRFNVSCFSRGGEVQEALNERVFHFFVLSSHIQDMDCLDLINNLKNISKQAQFIIITKSKSPEQIMQFIKYGITNLLEHPVSKEKLVNTLDNVASRMESVTDEKPSDPSYRPGGNRYFGFIGESDRMQAVYRTIDSSAESKATVFITGESGTGKEVCAAAIHERSNRRGAEFVPINCAAIPRDLMESEIFGHTKGAFTGAHAAREGAAARANGGTLFLDEIGEMDLDLQSKLLRFIQTGTFQKVGSSVLETVDVRFVCATNRDPLEQVRKGTFREDLYYRLHVIPIYLPPLRERERDLLLIARAFLKRFSEEEARDFKAFATETEKRMLSYEWPGNIRQLQNVVRNIVVLNNGEEVMPNMLPPPLDSLEIKSSSQSLVQPLKREPQIEEMPQQQPPVAAENIITTAPVQQDSTVALDVIRQMIVDKHRESRSEEDIKPLWQIEKETIEDAIAICGNIPKAANRLGVSPSTVYRKLHNWKDQGLI